MRSRITLVFALFSILNYTGCKPKQIESVTDFEAYISNVENGLVKSVEVNGIIIEVMLVPQEFLLAKTNDSIYYEAASDQRYYFSINLIPKDSTLDLSYYGLHNPNEYTQRQYDLNFGLREQFELLLDEGNVLVPRLYHWENTYGITTKKNIQVAFSDENLKDDNDKIILRFTDPIFDTGINTFEFDKEKLTSLPEVNIL